MLISNKQVLVANVMLIQPIVVIEVFGPNQWVAIPTATLSRYRGQKTVQVHVISAVITAHFVSY